MTLLQTSKKLFGLGLVLSLILSAFSLVFFAPAEANAQAGQARVRVAHMSPDAPAVDVYVNGNKTLSNVAFKTVSSYLAVPAGTYRFEVRPAGAAATSAAVIDANATLAANKAYTVVASGLLANIKAVIFDDDLSAPPAGQAKIEITHASPDAPAVDIAPKGGQPVFRNVSFPNGTEYLALPAGTYDFEVRPTGTTTVALAINGAKLDAGKIYTVFAANVLAKIEAVVVVADPVAAGGTPTAPASGFGGMDNASSNFALVAVAALFVVAVAAGGTLVVRRSR